jgi:hypothetical protein
LPDLLCLFTKRFTGFFIIAGLRDLYRMRGSTRTTLGQKKNHDDQKKSWLELSIHHKLAPLPILALSIYFSKGLPASSAAT